MKSDDLVDDRFRLIEAIGTGGMGEVFRARDEQRGDAIVALKVIAAETAEQIRRATQEIELLASLDHPGIVRHVADGPTDNDQLYLAMEWIDGVTLADRLAHGGLTLRQAVELVRIVAGALGTAHVANVVHRDIKPSNILLEQGDPARPRVIDFGLARLVGTAYRSVTRTGTTLGTPGYMSPEQARGVRELTPASDVFNLGVVLYECVTGRAAFSGGNLASLMIDVVLAEPPPLAELCPEAPAALAELVASTLAKEPAGRPRDGHAMAAALAALGAMPDGPARSTPAETPEPTVRNVAPPVHCLVLAAHGLIDDVLDPPSAEQRWRLIDAATAAGAHLEVLGTGALVAHFEGAPPETARRAALFALAMKIELKTWTVAISTINANMHVLAEDGARLLARATKAEVFARTRLPDGITIDPGTAALLQDEFLLLRTTPPRLVGKR